MKISVRAAGLALDRRVGAEQVVGLEIVVVRHGPPEGAEELGRVVPLRDELLRHLRAVGVVGLVELLAVLRRLGAEAEDDGARVVVLDLAQDEVRGAEQGVHRPPVRALDRVG